MDHMRQIPPQRGGVHKKAAQQPAYNLPTHPSLELYFVDHIFRYTYSIGTKLNKILSGEYYTKSTSAA